MTRSLSIWRETINRAWRERKDGQRNLPALVVLCGLLAPASAGAQQVCLSGTPQTTPTVDFTDHGNGTVTHDPTGLMWKQCLEGLNGVDCATGTVGLYTWQQALQLADGHSFAGYSDWRLPNTKELTSIVERSCYDPAINLSVFPGNQILNVWSGSPLVFGSGYAWMVEFQGGVGDGGLRSTNNRVRLVRDAP